MNDPLAGATLRAFVPSNDLARSRAFYSDVLGLDLLSGNDFGLEFAGRGTTLRVTAVGDFAAHPFTVLGWEVPDITAACRELVANGVELLLFDGMGQDAHGVWNAPSGTKVAWFKDPDGNVLSFDERPGG